MNWQVLLAISVITAAISALMQKLLAGKKSINPIAFAAGFQLTVSIFIGIVLLFKGFHLPNLKPIALNLILVPLLYSLGNISKFKALKKIEASEFTVIFQVSTVITVLIAVIFLGESFNLTKVLGLGLVLIAVLLVTLKNQVKFQLSTGELWGFVCAASFGVAIANDVYILRTFDVWSFTFLAFLIPGLLTLALLGKDIKEIKGLVEKKVTINLISSAFFYGVSALTFYAAYQLGRNAAQLISFAPVYSILVVILAAIFLKERDSLPKKLFAAILAVVGIVLLK